jgi:sec-independent protein translocase protein TatB
MRSFGFYAGKLRRAAADFRRQFDEAMREAELEEVKQAIESVKTETHALNETAPLDRPLMVEGPKTPAPKPAAKTPRKRSAAKAKTPAKASAKRAKSGAGPAP